MSLENENKNYDNCNTEAISTSEDCNCDNTDYNPDTYNYMDYYNNIPSAQPIPPCYGTPYGYGMIPYGMLPMQPQPYPFTNNDIYNEPYYDYENDDNTEDDVCRDDDINDNSNDDFSNLTRSRRSRRRRRRRRYDYPYYYPGGFPFWLWWFL